MRIARINPRFTGFHIVSKFVTTILGIFVYGSVTTITMFPFVFYSNKYIKKHIITKNKQKIYIQQQMECGMAGILIYFILGLILRSWLVTLPVIFLWCFIYTANHVRNLFVWHSGIFWSDWKFCSEMIAFKRETNRYANILHYTVLRRPFAWINLISFHSIHKGKR